MCVCVCVALRKVLLFFIYLLIYLFFVNIYVCGFKMCTKTSCDPCLTLERSEVRLGDTTGSNPRVDSRYTDTDTNTDLDTDAYTYPPSPPHAYRSTNLPPICTPIAPVPYPNTPPPNKKIRFHTRMTNRFHTSMTSRFHSFTDQGK